ncbi:hypothetical protein OH76DRAFT_1298733, partial [Lentinus brumalis]
MPRPQRNWDVAVDNSFITEQLDYNVDTERSMAEAQIRDLNDGQRAAFERIVQSIENHQGQLFFVDGPGGTGKTFLYDTLCHKLRAESRVVLCVASSGIASLLLPGGRTAHSRFKIPVEHLTSDSVCSVDKQSRYAAMLRLAADGAIIWDEAANQHRWAPEAVDRLFRDLLNSDQPFGGVTVI